MLCRGATDGPSFLSHWPRLFQCVRDQNIGPYRTDCWLNRTLATNRLLGNRSSLGFKNELPVADSIASVRLIESQAAHAYWSAWRTLPVNFPRKELPRVPAHWLYFGTRISPLTGSPRLAVTPACAMMNYAYSLLESEASLANRALGLDAAMGIFHVDQSNRDSLACDLMEPVRPRVDSYLLDWITTQPLKREWFLEQRNGNARLMASLTEKTLRDGSDLGQGGRTCCGMGCASSMDFRQEVLAWRTQPAHFASRSVGGVKGGVRSSFRKRHQILLPRRFAPAAGRLHTKGGTAEPAGAKYPGRS